MPDGWTGRLLAMAILTGLVGGGYLLVAAPLRDLYIRRQVLLQDRVAMLTRSEAASREMSALRAHLAEMQDAGSERLMIDGSNDAIASADLLTLTENLAGTLGVSFASTEVLPAEDRGGLRLIRLRVAVNSDYESLLHLFGKLDSSRPLLIIENLQIRTNVRLAGMPRTTKLDAAFDISAFRHSVAPAKVGN